MAVTRLTNSGFTSAYTKYDDMLAGYPPAMAAPTAADGGTGSTATVSFTAVSGATNYRAISNPGSFTGTGSSSPITVSGLTAGTAYTFQIQAQNSVGYGAYSAASNSVTPVTPSSFESIATATGTGSSGTITFSSIPNTYKHLQIRATVKSTLAGTGNLNLQAQFNNDTASNYTRHYLRGSGSAVTANGAASQTLIAIGGSNQAGDTAQTVNIIDIIDYASTSKYKTTRSFYGNDQNGSGWVYLSSGLWMSTSAINSITFTLESSSVFGTTTQIALYGIKG